MHGNELQMLAALGEEIHLFCVRGVDLCKYGMAFVSAGMHRKSEKENAEAKERRLFLLKMKMS